MGDHIEEKASRETKEEKMPPLAEKAVKAFRPEKNGIASAMMIVSIFSCTQVKKSLAIPHAERAAASRSSGNGRRGR